MTARPWLGSCIAAIVAFALTIVSGIDGRSARRTAALYRGIGHSAAPVSPVAAAEFVALVQSALLTCLGWGGSS